MSYGSYNPGSRYRQRSNRRMASFLYSLFSFIVFFGLGFWLGGLKNYQTHSVLLQEKNTLQGQYADIQKEITQLRAEAQTAKVRLEQLKVSYNEVLPEGPMQTIVAKVKEQIEAGVDPQRIESVILSARPPQNCTEAKTKRLLVVTPNYKGPENRVSIENTLISVWGTGRTSRDQSNKEQAWFDSSKTVKLYFQPKDGVVTTKEGILPLYHSLVLGQREYRFTISADAKSFSKITYDSCDYP